MVNLGHSPVQPILKASHLFTAYQNIIVFAVFQFFLLFAQISKEAPREKMNATEASNFQTET